MKWRILVSAPYIQPVLDDYREIFASRGAALDVFQREPLPHDSPLKSMANVMLAQHNSNNSPAAWLRLRENTIRNLFEVLETEA